MHKIKILVDHQSKVCLATLTSSITGLIPEIELKVFSSNKNMAYWNFLLSFGVLFISYNKICDQSNYLTFHIYNSFSNHHWASKNYELNENTIKLGTKFYFILFLIAWYVY